MKASIVVLLVATLGTYVSVARNVINEHGPYTENNHFVIETDAAGNDIAVHILGGSSYNDIWRFEAYDSETGAPGYINEIDIRPLRPVGPIRLWITGAPGHAYGARDVKEIDLVTKKDLDTEIYGIYISGDLGEWGDIRADKIRNVHVAGSLLRPMWTRDDISGYVTIGGNLEGDIYADSIPNLAVGGTGPHTGDITIRGSYASTINLGGSMSGDIDIEGNHTGNINIAGNFSGDATVDWGMTGTIDITGNCAGSVNVADAMAGTVNVDGICSGDITVNDDVTGTVTINDDLAGTLAVAGDYTGSLAVDGDLLASGLVHIGGDCGGHITATGDLNCELQIDGSLLDNPSYTYEIDIDGVIANDAAIAVNWDAYYENSPAPDVWETGAQARIDGVTFTGNTPTGLPPFVWEVTCLRGDMNNDANVDVFDVDLFVAGTSGTALPGLAGTRVYHGDTNCDDEFDVFDIDSFVLRMLNEATWQQQFGCEICPVMLLAGGGGGAFSATPSYVATMLSQYTAPSRLSSLVNIVEYVAAQYPTATQRSFWGNVLGELD